MFVLQPVDYVASERPLEGKLVIHPVLQTNSGRQRKIHFELHAQDVSRRATYVPRDRIGSRFYKQ